MSKEWSKEVFSRNLRRYMSVANINQKDMADIVGVSAPTFNAYYNGEIFPRIDKIQKMADYFGIVKSDLIEDRSFSEAVNEKDNNVMADVVIRMKIDKKYLELVVELQKMDSTHLDGILSMVKSFTNNSKN